MCSQEIGINAKPKTSRVYTQLDFEAEADKTHIPK